MKSCWLAMLQYSKICLDRLLDSCIFFSHLSQVFVLACFGGERLLVETEWCAILPTESTIHVLLLDRLCGDDK